MEKTRQKNQKVCEIACSYLSLQQFDKFEKNREITSNPMNLLLAGLTSLKPLCAAVCLDRLEVCRLPQNHL